MPRPVEPARFPFALLEWVDSRLSFDENIFNGTLRIVPTEIWTPDVSSLRVAQGCRTVSHLREALSVSLLRVSPGVPRLRGFRSSYELGSHLGVIISLHGLS